MKNEELRDEKIIDINNEEVEEMEESKIKGNISKVVDFGKKHYKKVLGIGAVIGIGAIGYLLGHQSNDSGSIMKDFEADVDAVNSIDDVVAVTEE